MEKHKRTVLTNNVSIYAWARNAPGIKKFHLYKFLKNCHQTQWHAFMCMNFKSFVETEWLIETYLIILKHHFTSWKLVLTISLVNTTINRNKWEDRGKGQKVRALGTHIRRNVNVTSIDLEWEEKKIPPPSQNTVDFFGESSRSTKLGRPIGQLNFEFLLIR